MIAYSKPKKVEWFEYQGDTPEFREWCQKVNLIVRPQGEDLNLRMPERIYPDERKCAPLTLYKNLRDCVIVRGKDHLARMPKDHFLKHYEVPSLMEKMRELYREKIIEPVVKEMAKDYIATHGLRAMEPLTDKLLLIQGYDYDGVCWSKRGKSIGDYKDGYFVYTGDLSKRGRELKTYHDLLEFEYE